MRETVKSLRAYFVISGLFSLLGTASDIWSAPSVLELLVSLLWLPLGVAIVLVGFRLDEMLRTNPKRIQLTLAVAAGYRLSVAALLVVLGVPDAAVIQALVTLALAAYLYVNVRRLAAEQKSVVVEETARTFS